MGTLAGIEKIREADGIVRIRFDSPDARVNTLTERILMAFQECLEELANEAGIRGILIESGKTANFIAGADVREIQTLSTSLEAETKARLGQKIFSRLAAMPVPVAAVIHGTCLGGGTELILACTYRIASDDPSTRIGLPEVRLGIIPGFGGTQRLPRLVGLRSALDLILTGRELRASAALRIGLVDEVVPVELLPAAARRWIADHPVRRPAGQRPLERLFQRIGPLRSLVISLAERKLREKLKGGDYPAPFRALRVLQETYGGDLDQGLRVEARALGELALTPTAKNLMALFDLNSRQRRNPGLPEGGKARPVRRAAVVGAGIMGAGIALAIAGKGAQVRMKDVAVEPLARGLREAHRILASQVRRKRRTRRDLRDRMARIQPTLSYSGFRCIDFVVEAVFEDLELKRRILREIESNVSPECLIATNTSSLPIGEIGRVADHPGRFLGVHFFNPVHRMPLVEIVATDRTDPWAVATAAEMVKEIRKVPIVVRDRPGFLVNRLLMAYLGEALHLLEEGAELTRVDRALERFGMPMGPFRLLDQVGMDVASRVARTLNEAYGRGESAVELLEKLAAAKRFGVKNGKGFYLYQDGKPVPDPEIDQLVRPQGRIRPAGEEICLRTLLPMVNEAARCLEEEVVGRPGDVDLGMILGTGFPPFRGGLLRYADGIGIGKIVSLLEVMASRYGERMAPAELLLEMTRRGKNFFS